MDTFGIFLIGLAMVVGIAGTILPFLPGIPIVWAAALVYGVVAGFGPVGWTSFAIITALGVTGMVAAFAVPQRHVQAGGAPFSTTVAGVIGGIIGFVVIPVIGIVVGAVAGVLVAERLRTRDWSRAWTSTKRAIVGFGLGAAVQITAGLLMMGTWIAWVILD
ncbi:MAG: DUF456 domain-containing protein [Actinobacteria bacterium]|nr:DUF456 domain-containing protein [Actinomycetota bacterium]